MNNPEESFYQMILSFTAGIGAKTAASMIEYFGSAEAAYKATEKQLKTVNHLTASKIQSLHDEATWKKAEQEWEYTQKNNIDIVYKTSAQYPPLLHECRDAPQVLYKKGTTELKDKKCVAIVGTRSLSEYGARVTEDLVKDLAVIKEVVIVSGLAQGVDAVAHRSALKYQLPTIGVLGHGLNTLYPPTHKNLAQEIITEGGALLTEYCSKDIPEKGNFPMRNRIVAGMSHVTVVVESKIKGGAMITAYLAESYNREVVAIPGRTIDQRSEGCNHLIKSNVASLVTNANDILELMNWQSAAPKAPKQLKLVLSTEAQFIWDWLQARDHAHIDEISEALKTNAALLSGVLLEMEMDNLIKALPGKRYRIA